MRFLYTIQRIKCGKQRKENNQENLVIVESPKKAKTIEKIPCRNYKVMASVGLYSGP